MVVDRVRRWPVGHLADACEERVLNGSDALSPWLDMEVSGETLETHRLADTLVNRRMLEGMAATYLTDASPSDSQANLLKANLAGLLPVYVNAGSNEVLLSDTTRIADDALANIAR